MIRNSFRLLLIALTTSMLASCSLEVSVEPCDPGETKCDKDEVFSKCQPNGKDWEQIICGGVAHPGAFCHVEQTCVQCNDAKDCKSDIKHCVNHVCEPLSVQGCVEGSSKCEHETVRICRKQAWESSTLCTEGCNAAGTACATADEGCKKGTTRCVGGKFLTCLVDGTWNTGAACQDGQECVKGGIECTVIAEKACVEGESKCSSDGQLLSCKAEAWIASACDKGSICPDGKLACEPLAVGMQVRLDAGLKEGISSFDGKEFHPLLPYLTEGVAYNSDEGVVKNYPIAGTDFDALYQNESWVSAQPAVFNIPIDNGSYTVHLHFVDWVNVEPGKRQFHVDVQGERRLTDFDIVAEAGASTAIVKSYDIVVSDAKVTVTITNSVFYAEIAAIEILPVGVPHLATTVAAVCGAIDGQCPVGCTGDKDMDCPALACEGELVSTRCTCGTTVVTTGYCCAGKPQGAVCVVPPVLISPAFFVSPTGNDTNAGTSEAKPFKTLEKARDASRASTTTKTVYVMGGTHNRTSSLVLEPADKGQAWLGYPTQKPVLEGSSKTETAIAVNGDNITIRFITFQNFLKTSITIGWGGAKNVLIDSNTVLNTLSDGWTQAAIFVCCGNHSDLTISHNKIDGANYNGIGIHASEGSGGRLDNITVSQNAVYNTCRTVADCGAIYTWEPTHISKNIKINNNIVGHYGNHTNHAKGVYLDDNSSDITVENNIIYGTGHWALQYHGGHDNTFRNNIFDITEVKSFGFYQDTGTATPPENMAGNGLSCNIIYSDAAPQLSLWNVDKRPSTLALLIKDNVYWGTKGALANAAPVIDPSPKVVDPAFVNAGAHNYTFSGANPAEFCGFKPIDVSRVGPLSN